MASSLLSMLLKQTGALPTVGGGGSGSHGDSPAIQEIPPTKVACAFCHKEHDPKEKCEAMKQALRLKSDWDRESAAQRRADAAKEKAAKAEAKAAADAARP